MLIGMTITVTCALLFLRHPPDPWPLVLVIGMLAGAPLCIASAIAFMFRVPEDLRTARRRRGECESCGYTLTTGMHTCPECGQQHRV